MLIRYRNGMSMYLSCFLVDYSDSSCILHGMDINVADIRKRLFLTQPDMAAKAGLSIRIISNFETGDLNPSFRTTRRLADAYGLSFEEVQRAARINLVGNPSPVAGKSAVA